jgi:hypothetical protein
MENTPLTFPHRRTRTISFRVSEREFELLRMKSAAEGARSISDLARLVLCGPPTGSPDRLDNSLGELRGELQRLSVDLRRATELLQLSDSAAAERSPIAPPIALTRRKSTRGV